MILPDEVTQWGDLDGDGYGDNPVGLDYDEFPFDPTQSSDLDADGYGDNLGGTRGDACITTPGTSTEDRFGCIDSDGDGWSDAGDGFPQDGLRWLDTDNDGYEDSAGCLPLRSLSQHLDSDGDGFGDNSFGSNADRIPKWMLHTMVRHRRRWIRGQSSWRQLRCLPRRTKPMVTTATTTAVATTLWTKSRLLPERSTQCKDEDGDGFGDNQSGNNPDPSCLIGITTVTMTASMCCQIALTWRP